MRYIKGRDSRQMTLGIWSIEEEVAQNSAARFIEVFVDSLDMAEMGIRRAKPAHTGSAPRLRARSWNTQRLSCKRQKNTCRRWMKTICMRNGWTSP